MVGIPPTLAQIFGAGYYDDFDFGDSASLSLTGSSINSCTSQVSARQLVATGVNRPLRVTNQINGRSIARFDGADDFMEVAASTALYNFLHNTTGGFIMSIYKTTDANPNTNHGIVLNTNSSAATGIIFAYDDLSSSSRSNAYLATIYTGVAGLGAASSVVNDVITPQQFNIIASVFNGGNAIAADRLIPYTNSILQAQNNVLTNAASSSNAAFNLTVGKRPAVNDFRMKGDLARLIFISGVPTPSQISQAHNRIKYEYGNFPI